MKTSSLTSGNLLAQFLEEEEKSGGGGEYTT
jgi:hypothetical protein